MDKKFDEEDTDYMFTIGQIKSAWKMCYNEDLAEEYSGFVHILESIIKEREFNGRRNYK